jgi:mono/diheme cytochrome c family protein
VTIAISDTNHALPRRDHVLPSRNHVFPCRDNSFPSRDHSFPSRDHSFPSRDRKGAVLRITMSLCIFLATCAIATGQGRGGGGEDMTARGVTVFNQSCATGYCHGVKGTSGGAPRLAARGFDAAYITQVVRAGIQGTAMPAFGTTLSRADMTAVVAYVGSLNGIAPTAGLIPERGMPRRNLPPEAQKGRALFYDAIRGFGRCSACHQVDGTGIAVADPIAKVPENVAALRALASPHIVTATAEGSTFPALVLSKGAVQVKLYDLTMQPPVLRTFAASDVRIAERSNWSHATAMAAYKDAELESILAYLRVAVSPEKP